VHEESGVSAYMSGLIGVIIFYAIKGGGKRAIMPEFALVAVYGIRCEEMFGFSSL